MITTDDVMQWVKTLGAFDNETKYTMARLDGTQIKRIGVYPRTDYAETDIAIGGRDTTVTRIKPVQVLIHWTKNARDTENTAQALYDALAFNPRGVINNHPVSYIDLQSSEPIDLGADDNGIFERVIRFDIHYQEG